MRSTVRPALVALTLALCGAAPASALMQVTIVETGGDVVVSYSGGLDTTGLALESSAAVGDVAGINPLLGTVALYTADIADSYAFTLVPGDGWGPLGTGDTTLATSLLGDAFGFGLQSETLAQVLLPDGYVDLAPLAGTFSFAGATFDSLGLTAGVYSFALPADSIAITISSGAAAVPLPAAAPLLAAGLAGLALAARRRRRG